MYIHISIIIWMSHSIGNGNTWMNIIQIFSHKNKWNQTNKKLSLFHFIHCRQSATQTFDIKLFGSLSVTSPLLSLTWAAFKQIMKRQLYSKFSSQRCISNPHLTGVVNGDVYLHFLSQPLLYCCSVCSILSRNIYSISSPPAEEEVRGVIND